MSQSHNNGETNGEVRRTVLVVDDEPTLRLGFSYALASRSTSVDTAATGRQALDKIKTSHYDIVILDLRMPDIDGVGVIEALRKSGNQIPIVLCSAAITSSAALLAIQHQVLDFLLKPVRPADLRDVVDYVLDPPATVISRTLVAARTGDIQSAIHLVKSEAARDRTAAAWLKVFELVGNPSGDASPPTGDSILGSVLTTLAFRSSRGH